MPLIQSTKVALRTCTIGAVPYMERRGDNIIENFAVHSLRVYEDICKAYFTGQLVIEDQLNATDPYLYPATEVQISWTVYPENKTYTEKFRVYSIESKPKNNDQYAGMLITINLIGDEYFNDTQNTVMMNIPNQPATTAAAGIHNQYIAENGGIQVSPSVGMIGTTEHPHQVLNMKPIKAIHDLLDKAVSAGYRTCAFTYFRNKPGYVIAPLEELFTTSAIVGAFQHVPAQGTTLESILQGYNHIIHFRPMAPPSEATAAGIRVAELDALMKTSSFFDMKTGNFISSVGSGGLQRALGVIQNVRSAQNIANVGRALLGSSVKSPFGARMIFNAINEDRQPRAVDKNGPGGYNTAEEAFLAAVSFSKKYWISVPMQTGIDVTIGRRINVIYPVRNTRQAKTLFVARLIHEIQFKTPGAKAYEPAQGTTDLYCVEW